MVDGPLPDFRYDPSFETLKTLVGVLLGLASILGGWIIFAENGFYVPILFLTGILMMPLGVLVLGTSLTGPLEEDQPNRTARVREERMKRQVEPGQ